MSPRLLLVGVGLLFIVACVGKAVRDDRRDARSVGMAYNQDADTDPDDNPNPSAGMKLLLERQWIVRKNGYATFYAIVQNTGTVPIPDGEVTILEYNHDGYQIGEIPGTLDIDPLPVGKKSTIKVEFPIRDADAKWGCNFTSAGGPVLPVTLGPLSTMVVE